MRSIFYRIYKLFNMNAKKSSTSSNFNQPSFNTSGYGSGNDVRQSSNGQSPSIISNAVSASVEQYLPYPDYDVGTGYDYDVMLIYDPSDYYLTEELLGFLNERNLRTYDFTRDAPPGLPQRQSFQTALRLSRYTCIVVTRFEVFYFEFM